MFWQKQLRRERVDLASHFHSIHSHISHSEHNSSFHLVTCNQQMYPGKLATHLQTRNLLVSALLLGNHCLSWSWLTESPCLPAFSWLPCCKVPSTHKMPCIFWKPFHECFFLQGKHSQDMSSKACMVPPVPVCNLSVNKWTSASTIRPLPTPQSCRHQSWAWGRSTAVPGEGGREGGTTGPQTLTVQLFSPKTRSDLTQS